MDFPAIAYKKVFWFGLKFKIIIINKINHKMVKLFLAVIILIIKCVFSNDNIDLTYKNNYYILLSSSKFYFNQRHTTNVMVFY